MSMVNINRDCVTEFRHGSTAVGTSAVVLDANDNQLRRGVLVKAAIDNTDNVYVGGSGVTADSSPTKDGYPLDAGQEVFIPIDKTSKVYVIGGAAAQQVFWLAE